VTRIRTLTPVLLVIVLFGSACVRRVSVNEVLPVLQPVSTETLIGRINAYGQVTTFSAAVENIWFLNYFTGLSTKADKYPATAGEIRFQRPENTRMRVTFIGKKLSDMVSDGQRFKLAVYWPEDKRRFIHGSNLKDLEQLDIEEIRQTRDTRLNEAGGLLNLRPQHITDSFLIKPITESDKLNVFREELRQVERVAGKKNFVERTYYVIYVLERDDTGQAKLRRKFWFDRTQQGTPLVRQQTFENGDGRLASDVTYSDWFAVGGASGNWPGKVTIDRRADGYRLELELDKASVDINGELPALTFTLENNERLEELDLDKPRREEPRKASAGTNPPKNANLNPR
jgi:hypothetical protein